MTTFSSGMREAHSYYRWIADRFRPHVGMRFLEVGVGGGQMLSLLPEGCSYAAVDIDAQLLADLRIADATVADIQAEDFVARIGGARFDTVLCFNVLEHVENDGTAVRNLLSVLEPGGHLLLLVPAFQFLFNDMDSLAGHCRRYTSANLSRLVPGELGVVVDCSYFNPIGYFGWLANGLFGHKDLDSTKINTQIRVFEKYILPLSRMLDPLSRRFLGQSVVCVVRRR